MITVTSDFKDAMKASTKELKAYLTDNEMYPDEITESDDLKSVRIFTETSLLHSVMRFAEVNYFGAHDYLNKYVNLGIGVVLPDTSTEYIDYGSFKVVEVQSDNAVDGVKIKMFDKMYESLVNYDLDPIYDLVFPCTMLQLLEAICDRFSWTLGTLTFPNDDLVISTDIFTGQGLTYRQVLDMIAEAAGSLIYFDVDNELKLREIDFNSPLETLDANVLETFKVGTKYGEINSVVLSRMPQEDNILEKDQTSIDANGLTEIKIVNNFIVDSDRETYVQPIFDALFGLEFYPFEATTNGLGYFQVGDRVTLEDNASNSYETVILAIEINLTGGLTETLWTKIPDKNSTNYNYAGIVGQRIRNTEIIVDRQGGQIILLNEEVDSGFASITIDLNAITSTVQQNGSDIDTLQTSVTTLEQTVEGLELSVQGIGGTNLLKNSVGLKGNVVEWQTIDENGVPVDPDNDATIDQSTDVQINTESGSALVLTEQYLFQTFPTIAGEIYTYFARYKSTEDATLQITGISDITLPESTDWTTYKIQFTANSSSTTFRADNTAFSGGVLRLADSVIKLGDVNGWIQAPNEVYGANYKFDRDGFEITSLTDTFKSVLDNTKFAVYNTASGSDRIVMYIATDSAILTDLIDQDTFTLQRYENPTAALKMIATDDGAYLVIND